MHSHHHLAIAARACRSRLLRIPLLLLLCLLGAGGGLMPALGATFTDANWVSLGGIPGANGPVRAMIHDTAGNLYIGGDFTVVGNTVAKGVAKWDGTAWSALGEGVGNGGVLGQPREVKALAILGDELYVGGNFTHAGGVERHGLARWRLTGGGGWSDGGLATGDVKALLVHNTELYVGGAFARTGITENLMLAKWNGSTWTPMSNGSGQGVRALAVASGSLYVGGTFSDIAGIQAVNIAKWTIGPAVGAGWSSLGAGVEGGFGAGVGAHALQVVGNGLYVGGQFNGSGVIESANLIRWSISGNAWFPIPRNADGLAVGLVSALAATSDELFVGGLVNPSGGAVPGFEGIGKWAIGSTDGSGWSKMGAGVQGTPHALLLVGNTLHVGGQFAYAGGYGRNNLAKWALGGPENDSNWSALAPAGTAVSTLVNSAGVRAVAVVGSDLYVGGYFQSVGGVAATNVAKWNGTSWSALGAGIGIVDGWVRAMVSHGSDLYVLGHGGVFRWDGSQWNSVGSPFSHELWAMAVAGEHLYLVGDSNFGIRRWRIGSSDTTWEKLADGVTGTAFSMAVVGQDLYVGGGFASAGGIAGTKNIVRWRLDSAGNAGWSALGTGVGTEVTDSVWALAVAGEHLYVGGVFSSANGATHRNIVRWTLGGTDDNSWSPVGLSGIGDGGVRALAVVGSELFVGGQFNSAGGQTGRTYIAKWTLGGTGDSSWAAVGSGISDRAGVNGAGVYAMTTAANGDLFVGGRFTIAGGKAAGHIAKLVPPNEPPTVTLFAPAIGVVGQPVPLTATATDPDGTVVRVEFFAGETQLGEDTTDPFTLAVITLGEGEHSLTARATDNRGLTGPPSNEVKITILAPPRITRGPEPDPLNLEAGTNGELTVEATGSPELRYQWFFGNDPVDGATEPVLRFVNIQPNQAGGYRVEVTNDARTVPSGVVEVTVFYRPPRIITPPVSRFFDTGDAFALTAVADGTPPLTYQWQFNGENIPGATGPTLPLSGLMVTNAGAYRVIVTNPAASVPSEPAKLTFFGDLQFIASLVLAGEVGQAFRVEFSDALAPGATDWLVLTNLTLPHSPFLVIDPMSRGKPNRYYRAVNP